MNDDNIIEIKESELYEVYSMLADATDAAAAGNPNDVASNAADAKKKVLEISEREL